MKAAPTIQKILPYTTVVLALVVIYVAFVFFSRWNESHMVKTQAEIERERADAKVVEMYGSGNLKIVNFYTRNGSIRRGEKALLCYGVANATAVRIEPGVEPITPSLSRCIEVAPHSRTEYTLTAEDNRGNQEKASLVVNVK